MTTTEFLQQLIPLVTPLILFAVRWAIPRLPKGWIPWLAPVVGAGLDLSSQAAGLASLGPASGAVLGLASVGLREMFDQFQKGNMLPKPTPAAPILPPKK